MLRPQDVVVLLKLSLLGEERPPYLKIANAVHMYPSEVYTSVKRARASQLLQGPEMHDRVNRSGLSEFLIHGIRYAFPAEKGALTRGIPTSYGASPLNEHIDSGSEPLPVWPYAEGHTRGFSFVPLHKNVPQAALEDVRLYQLLALVDAMRDGRVRERKLAVQELRNRLEYPAHAQS
jgi:hypothetical protein